MNLNVGRPKCYEKPIFSEVLHEAGFSFADDHIRRECSNADATTTDLSSRNGRSKDRGRVEGRSEVHHRAGDPPRLAENAGWSVSCAAKGHQRLELPPRRPGLLTRRARLLRSRFHAVDQGQFGRS